MLAWALGVAGIACFHQTNQALYARPAALLWALHLSRRMHRHIPCAGAGPVLQRAHSFVKKVEFCPLSSITLGSRFCLQLRSHRAVPRQALACSDSRTAQLSSLTFDTQPFLLKLSTLAVFHKRGYSRTHLQRCIGRTFRLARQHASMQVPPDLCRALESTGIESVPDFAFAYNSTADLDVFLSDKYDELWLGLGITDPVHSPAMARLRRALKRAQNLTELADSPATASSSTPTALASLNA